MAIEMVDCGKKWTLRSRCNYDLLLLNIEPRIYLRRVSYNQYGSLKFNATDSLLRAIIVLVKQNEEINTFETNLIEIRNKRWFHCIVLLTCTSHYARCDKRTHFISHKRTHAGATTHHAL